MKHRIRERAIYALLDGRLKDEKRRELETHLEQCGECHECFRQAKVARGALQDLDVTAPPPLDWARIDAAIESCTTVEPRRPLFGNMALWGAMAAVTATALLVTLIFSDGPLFNSDQPDNAPSPVVASATQGSASEEQRQEPVSLEAFVTFVAGEAGVALPGERWQALDLEAPLNVGTRLRTNDRGEVGIQIGMRHACRLQPETEVRFTNLGSPDAHMELLEGQVTCTVAGEHGDQENTPPLVLSVMDVVASASGEARFTVRREPQVIVVELAEGTLRVSPDGGQTEVISPERLVFRQEEDGEYVAERSVPTDDERLASPEPPLLPRRTISSLQIPRIDGVDRVSVDGVMYGILPLNLRRPPGTARLELFTENGEPLIHEVLIGLGPRVLEIASLGPLNEPAEQAPGERRVAPRLGTYNETHVRRLRSVVSSKVRRCYERMLKRNPSIWGRINVRFTVSTSGEPRRVQVRSLAGGDSGVNACIERSLASEQFPPPIGGYVPVEQNITLSPQF